MNVPRIRPTLAIIASLPLVLSVGYSGDAAAAQLFSYCDIVSYDVNDNPLVQIDYEDSDDYTVDTMPVFCVGSTNIGAPGVSAYTYNTSAQSLYGELKVRSEAAIVLSIPGSGGPEYIDAAGSASFRDQWTITGAPAGTAGTLALAFDITGSYDEGGADTGGALFMRARNMTASVSDLYDLFTFFGAGVFDETAVLSLPFIFGEEFDFEIKLFAEPTLFNLSAGGYDGQSIAWDLFNTATINAIAVEDEAGTIVSDFGLSTASGAEVFDELAPIPVPAAAWLFGSGLGLLGWLRRRQTA